ncbi:MAG: tRNA dihydrouridine synthase DusB [Bacteroidota bacterium]|jgi:tRNA-dihydrouridine synthase B|nr:tRNA dihydrouridine synthase DusB [Bacteroidota bacterium]
MNLFESLGIRKGLLLAPMEDVTDMSFRQICKEFGADLVYTEFVNADGLVRSSKPTKTRQKMLIREEERPVGIQIYGGNMDTMLEAARIAEAEQPDLLDINAGCWVKKVAGRGAGAGLLRDLPAMVEMARGIVDAVRLPVTLKTRIGWDHDSIRIVELAKMLEDVGIRALTVHCRTRQQGHSGDADWSWIPKIKAAVSMPVILNGGVMSPEDARRAFDETGCDAVMIARGAIANPWIFRETKYFMETGILPEPPTFAERIATAVRHLRLAVRIKGERRAVLEMRKHYIAYLKFVPNSRQMRMILMKPETLAEAEDVLQSLLFYEHAAGGFSQTGTTTEEENLVVPGNCCA